MHSQVFCNLEGDWVSASSEVPDYPVGKDRLRFGPDAQIEYSFEHEGRVIKQLFSAEKLGEEFILRPPEPNFGNVWLQIAISTRGENKIAIKRMGLITVFQKKPEPDPNS